MLLVTEYVVVDEDVDDEADDNKLPNHDDDDDDCSVPIDLTFDGTADIVPVLAVALTEEEPFVSLLAPPLDDDVVVDTEEYDTTT